MQQLREFAEHKADFDREGARIVAVSTDDQEHARLVYDKQVGRKFPILSDPGLSAIRAYGLVHGKGHAGEDIAIRATIVIDKDGIERWRRVSDSVPDIPKSADVLDQLRALK
jgi:peroxiredoxin